MNNELLLSATAFLWAEADMLDHKEYATWLDLWSPDGLYIVPIDPTAEDMKNTLNYAYDDAHMRSLRITRLTGGESMSTQPTAHTVRNVSRLRVLKQDGTRVTVRGAQDLRDFRKDAFHQHTADVTWELDRHGDTWRIQRKVIRLINSTATLSNVGYLL